ncbi:MAG: universal stress protein [Verrucomicrobiota bacterium]
MKRILVPVDFSPATKAVVKTALDLASPGARIIILHGLIPPLVTTDYGMGLGAMQETIALSERNARNQLEHLAASLAKKDLVVTTELTHGGAPGAILDAARRHKVDAIVLGSHGHTSFYDLVVGSTTHAVIKKAPCPVVVVPPSKTQPKPARKKR